MNVTDEKLQEISDLASSLVKQQRQAEDLEKALDLVNANIRQLSETLIPEAMMSVGMESFKLKDGTSVKVEKFYAGSISAENQLLAFNWLRETGNDSLIKREIKLNFGKGEDKMAAQALLTLREAGFDPADKSSIHPMTLKSFIREQMESGNPNFPASLFGAFVGNRTKIAPATK